MSKRTEKIARIDNRHPHPEIVLVGQPNCGKSTIFNSMAGYRSIATNFPGATVEYLRSHVAIAGRKCNLIDLPGIYAFTALDQAAVESRNYLLTQKIDIIINVCDASMLGRSLDLTLELMGLDVPMVLCLNMIDEAERKGINIDTDKLSQKLGIPVISTIASKGIGLDELLRTTFHTLASPRERKPVKMSAHVEEKVTAVEKHIRMNSTRRCNCSPRLAAIKLIEDDPFFSQELCIVDDRLRNTLHTVRKQLQKEHGTEADAVMAAERHSQAMSIFNTCSEIRQPKKFWRDKLDDILMHPVFGLISMLLVLYLFFITIFKVGALIEAPLLAQLDSAIAALTAAITEGTLFKQLVVSSLQGISGGISIVLPYLIPFLIGLAILEDVGYLPRIAFLLDSFMHKIGLHGTAVIPGLLGYGCSVPAIMATRILNSPRDRFIAAVVSILIPCSARMVIIMGLVGYYIGGGAAFGIYVFNIIIVTIIGFVLASLMPEDVPGMIMEIPSYHRPRFSVILAKTWLRMRDFIIVAWPLLIAGSIVLGLATWFQLDDLINQLTRPITFILNLPREVGTTLIFGIMRKELSMLMLFQALGTQDVISVMSKSQILVFTLFIVFYIPCLATLGVMGREIGWKKTALASLGTFVIALVIAAAARLAAMILF